jgi:hypothetical protein
MSELTTKRTLVKSPPELWAEVSDLEALARHLGEFGEIQITRLEPETTVVWEGDRVSGTVRLEPSGWGTKVTLTAELAAIEEAAAPEEPGVVVEEPAVVVEEPAVVVEEPAVVVEEPAVEEEPVPLPEPVAVEAAPPSPIQETPVAQEPRRGFWARLFGRRVAEVPPAEDPPPPPAVEEPAPEPPPVQEPPAPAPPPLQPVPDPQPPAEPEHDEPLPAAELDDDRAVAVLTEVLDNLGSAHHRPFSRG